MLQDISLLDLQLAKLAAVSAPAALVGPPGEVLHFKLDCEKHCPELFTETPENEGSSGYSYRGFPIYRCHEFGAVVPVTQFVLDALRAKSEAVLF